MVSITRNFCNKLSSPFPGSCLKFRRAIGTMSEEVNNHVNEEDDRDDPQQGKEKPKKHDAGAADLEKVTDYEEEKEISSQDINNVS